MRKVTPGGTITTFAGGGSSFGDGGPATSAQLRSPYGVAVDGQGNVYIADFPDHRVRKVSPGGTITTFAGTGAGGFSGDGGPATSARSVRPVWRCGGRRRERLHRRQPELPCAQGCERVGSCAPTLTLGGASTQPLLSQQGITVTARCDKPCSLVATGSVTIVGTQSVVVLARASAKLAAGTRTLTLHCSAAEQKRFRKLFKPGKQARAVITVKAKDKAGNTSTSKRTVTVRR